MGQGISFSQFVLFGKRNFTSTGYRRSLKSYTDPVQSSASDVLENIPTLEGKNIAITGANSGIGKELATYAAAKGANVFMICRSEERAQKAKDDIVEKTKTAESNINILLGDMSELADVRKVAEELQNRNKGNVDKLDCLVCNAGLLLNERQETKEGNEVTYACHLLGGSFYLTSLLLPQLKNAGSEARVIFVSSGGMYTTNFPSKDWDQVTSKGKYAKKYDGQMQYAYMKRGQVLLAERWARDYPEITFVSCHPGWCRTNAVEMAYGSLAKLLEPMRDTWEGAEGIAWLMDVEKKRLKSGSFYLDRAPETKHISGPFFTEGSYSKNTEEDVDVMMENLKNSCGL